MSDYFKPVRYEKRQKRENFFKTRNFYFWGNSRLVPAVPFLLAGILVLTQIVLPMYFFTAKATTPVVAEKSVLGYSSGYRAFEFAELPQPEKNEIVDDIPDYFYLTVPKLNIQNFRVETNSTNLSPDDAIGHYKGSALPGVEGTTYLYGHSVLPIFYNSRNPKAVFSKLDKLSDGDEIIVTYANTNYVYKVKASKILPVSQVNPLADKSTQRGQNSLVLMTCWPAGTKAKRFEVIATLETN